MGHAKLNFLLVGSQARETHTFWVKALAGKWSIHTGLTAKKIKTTEKMLHAVL